MNTSFAWLREQHQEAPGRGGGRAYQRTDEAALHGVALLCVLCAAVQCAGFASTPNSAEGALSSAVGVRACSAPQRLWSASPECMSRSDPGALVYSRLLESLRNQICRCAVMRARDNNSHTCACTIGWRGKVKNSHTQPRPQLCAHTDRCVRRTHGARRRRPLDV